MLPLQTGNIHVPKGIIDKFVKFYSQRFRDRGCTILTYNGFHGIGSVAGIFLPRKEGLPKLRWIKDSQCYREMLNRKYRNTKCKT